MHQIIVIGIWDGDYARLIALLIPYSIELRVRVIAGNKIVIKDLKNNYRKCVLLGGKIEIPYYESSIDRAIQDFASDVAELRECCDILEAPDGTNHQG